MIRRAIHELITRAIIEDVGDGDHSSLSCIPKTAIGKAKLIIKDTGIIAGIDVAEMVFNEVDKNVILSIFIKDGDKVSFGDIAFEVQGKQQSILKAERLVLNIMQRMSGIASETRRYVDEIKEFKTNILDTRKTTPGFRVLEKEAVRIGGGINHRMGLYDMIMLKDNHIDYAGGISKAIFNTHKYLTVRNKKLKIEIEIRTLAELHELISYGGVDRIMLDNFTPEATRKAVKIVNGQYEIESSGGITFNKLKDYASCGVDFISVGALSHQIKSLDMSLKAL